MPKPNPSHRGNSKIWGLTFISSWVNKVSQQVGRRKSIPRVTRRKHLPKEQYIRPACTTSSWGPILIKWWFWNPCWTSGQFLFPVPEVMSKKLSYTVNKLLVMINQEKRWCKYFHKQHKYVLDWEIQLMLDFSTPLLIKWCYFHTK